MLLAALPLAATQETLTWFLGNTFALAAWWLVSGFLSGVFLGMFGGTVSLWLTGKAETQVRTERLVGAVGGALIGLSGGATVGMLGEFSGLIGMVYLWGFVGMMTAAFLGTPRPEPVGHFEEDWDCPEPTEESAKSSYWSQLAATCGRLGIGHRVPGELLCTLAGGTLGVLYGILTSLLVPMSATIIPDEEAAHSVAGAAAVWAMLAGFGGWVAGSRAGARSGILTLFLGLLIGTSLGGVIGLTGELVGAVATGAINGAIGGAFFGSIAAREFIDKRFP
jgi:hypothetical protein